jgi:hypothetical protein
LSAVFDRLIKTHISLRLGDGSSLGALSEELVAVAGITFSEWSKLVYMVQI